MPLTGYINGTALEPEHLEQLSIAFEDTCRALGLINRADPLVEFVAKKMIAIALAGERDAGRLRDLTIAAIKL